MMTIDLSPTGGAAGLLTIILVVAKALGFVTFSWWWAFSPLLFLLGFWLIIFLLLTLFVILAAKQK